MSKKKVPAVGVSDAGKKIPGSYRELVKAFRALLKECEIAKQVAARNWESIGEWKARAAKLEEFLAASHEKTLQVDGQRMAAESARDLALSGKEGAERRETQLSDTLLSFAESEREMRSQIRYLETRLTWAENAKHSADLREPCHVDRDHLHPRQNSAAMAC
jgi:hypothetical protein